MKIFALGMFLSIIINFSACFDSLTVTTEYKTITPQVTESTLNYSYEDIKAEFGQYNYISYIITENTRMALNKENKYGYIDEKGNIIIPFEYDYADDFKQGFAVVGKNKKYGIIDYKNNLIIPIEYDYIENCFDHRFAIKENGKYGVMNEKGKIIIPCVYDSLEISFNTFPEKINVINTYIVARQNGKFGVISNTGEMLIPFEYDSITGINNQTVIACKNDLWGVLKTDNSVIFDFSEIPFTHIGGDYLFKGRLFDGTACLCSTSGQIFTNPGEYIPVDYSEEIGITAYGNNGKIGILNKAGVPENVFIYDSLTYMGKGYFNFSKDDISGVLKNDKCIVMDFEYFGNILLDSAENIYYINKEKNLVSVLSPKGIVIKTFEAVDFTLSGNSLLLILKDGTMTCIFS